MHALRILRCHGLSTESPQYHPLSVVVANLTYASFAWWGFTTADDSNRMDGLLKRGVHVGLYEGPTVSQLVEDADNRLFNNIYYEQHVRHRLLPGLHNAQLQTIYSGASSQSSTLRLVWCFDYVVTTMSQTPLQLCSGCVYHNVLTSRWLLWRFGCYMVSRHHT